MELSWAWPRLFRHLASALSLAFLFVAGDQLGLLRGRRTVLRTSAGFVREAGFCESVTLGHALTASQSKRLHSQQLGKCHVTCTALLAGPKRLRHLRDHAGAGHPDVGRGVPVAAVGAAAGRAAGALLRPHHRCVSTPEQPFFSQTQLHGDSFTVTNLMFTSHRSFHRRGHQLLRSRSHQPLLHLRRRAVPRTQR